MNILFFDCESNGFPKFKNPSDVNHKTGRAISLAWELADATGNILSSHHYLIKPEGWLIPKEDFWINHGFFQRKSEEQGFPILHVVQLFNLDFSKSEILVAHNIAFDKKIVFC
jgi:DNA polymerase III alpha subunit (gram-positive type)